MIDWKDSAREDVRNIYSDLLDTSISYADEWSSQLEKKLTLIEQFPEMGRMVPDYYLSFVREVFIGNYRLVYSTQSATPVVLAIRPMGKPLGKL